MRPSSLWALLAALLLGCLGPAVDGDAADVSSDVRDASIDVGLDAPRADVPITGGDLLTDFCLPLGRVACRSRAECGCGVRVPGGVVDVEACAALWGERCVDDVDWVWSGDGLIDVAAATACVASITEWTPACASPDPRMLEHCEPFVIAPVAFGERCTGRSCADGAGHCSGLVCTPRREAGMPCDGTTDCATGLVCRGGTCRPPREVGDACEGELECAPPLRCLSGRCAMFADIGEPCSLDTECAVGLWCQDGLCAVGTCAASSFCGNLAGCRGPRSCQPRVPLGGDCRSDRDCAPDLYCNGACTARPVDGERCARSNICAPGLGCDSDGGTCRPLPGNGEPCAYVELPRPRCADGYGCRDGTCRPRAGEGESCGHEGCVAGLACVPELVCMPPRDVGGWCRSDDHCIAGTHCDIIACAADVSAGESCGWGRNACAGICLEDASGGESCRDAPGEGDPCGESSDCPDDLFCTETSLSCLPAICAAFGR